MSKKPYYITTAIAYTSGKPHIGNTYEIVLADSIARFKRQQGYDVFFQTGTDEHGQKIELKAADAGITPKEFVDNVSGEIKRIWDLMDTSYDKFVRTTDEYHEKQVQKIFKKLYDKGDIYKGHYEGWYCTPCEAFFTETQVTDCKCPDCGATVTKAQEEAYFFKMSNYAEKLIKHIEERQVAYKILPLLPYGWHQDILYFTQNEFADKVIVDGKEVECTFEDLNGKYNCNGFKAVDGKMLKGCDNLAAFVEAWLSRRYGITSKHLEDAERGLREQYKDKTVGGIDFGTIYAAFPENK